MSRTVEHHTGSLLALVCPWEGAGSWGTTTKQRSNSSPQCEVMAGSGNLWQLQKHQQQMQFLKAQYSANTLLLYLTSWCLTGYNT